MRTSAVLSEKPGRGPHPAGLPGRRLRSLARRARASNVASREWMLSGFRGLAEAILQGPHSAYLVGADGDRIELPPSAVEALKVVVDALSRRQSVTLISQDKELTSQVAADMLYVSRPHLIKLLYQGEIPFHRVGTHRRLTLEDVLAYRDHRDAERKAALDELARLSEALPGGYK